MCRTAVEMLVCICVSVSHLKTRDDTARCGSCPVPWLLLSAPLCLDVLQVGMLSKEVFCRIVVVLSEENPALVSEQERC